MTQTAFRKSKSRTQTLNLYLLYRICESMYVQLTQTIYFGVKTYGYGLFPHTNKKQSGVSSLVLKDSKGKHTPEKWRCPSPTEGRRNANFLSLSQPIFVLTLSVAPMEFSWSCVHCCCRSERDWRSRADSSVNHCRLMRFLCVVRWWVELVGQGPNKHLTFYRHSRRFDVFDTPSCFPTYGCIWTFKTTYLRLKHLLYVHIYGEFTYTVYCM